MPFKEHSFGKVSVSTESVKESAVSKDVKTTSAAAVASSGSSDSDKTSSQSSQPVVRRLKYEMCKNWREKGSCKYGDKCLFAHGSSELTKRSTLNGPEPAKPPANTVLAAVIETKEAAAVPEKISTAAPEAKLAQTKPAEPSKEELKPEVKAEEETTKLSGPLFQTPSKTDSPT